MSIETIQIIDRGRGAQLSTSRITVLDVFYYRHRGHDFANIHEIIAVSTAAIRLLLRATAPPRNWAPGEGVDTREPGFGIKQERKLFLARVAAKKRRSP